MSTFPQNPEAGPQGRPPSERSTKTRLVVLVVLILGVAAMLTWRTSPEDRAIDSTVRTIMDGMQEKQKEAEAKAIAMSKGRAFDFASAASPEELDRRIALTADAASVNDALLAFGNAAGAKIAADLRSQNVAAEKADKAASIYNDQVWATRKKMFTESGKMYAAGKDLLQYLRAHWGHWKYNAAQKSFDPETPEIASGITGRQTALQEALKAQKAAMTW